MAKKEIKLNDLEGVTGGAVFPANADPIPLDIPPVGNTTAIGGKRKPIKNNPERKIKKI